MGCLGIRDDTQRFAIYKWFDYQLDDEPKPLAWKNMLFHYFHPLKHWLFIWRIIPLSKWLVKGVNQTIYNQTKPILRGPKLTMVLNHLRYVLG